MWQQHNAAPFMQLLVEVDEEQNDITFKAC